jgi:hypothetical protein
MRVFIHLQNCSTKITKFCIDGSESKFFVRIWFKCMLVRFKPNLFDDQIQLTKFTKKCMSAKNLVVHAVHSSYR